MFWQNFERLCYQSGKSPSRVAESVGLSSTAAVGWKKGAVPRDSTIKQIADYFGVPVESLTADEPPTLTAFPAASSAPPTLAPGEIEILQYFRGFTREGQGRLLDFAESMKRSGMYEPGVDYFSCGMNAEPY